MTSTPGDGIAQEVDPVSLLAGVNISVHRSRWLTDPYHAVLWYDSATNTIVLTLPLEIDSTGLDSTLLLRLVSDFVIASQARSNGGSSIEH